MRSEPCRENGFTLIELLIVLVLLGLLMALAIPQVARMGESAKSKTARLQLETLSQSLLFYELDNGRYPPSLDALLQKPDGLASWSGPYVKGPEQLRDPWGRALVFSSDEDGSGFTLLTLGADGKEGGEGNDADIQLSR